MSGRPGIIIAARATSSRFPGKHFARFGDTTVLGSCIERCLATGLNVVVAVPYGQMDDFYGLDISDDECLTNVQDPAWFQPVLYAPSERLNIAENDVLGRVIACAEEFDIDPVIRVTGDCPLVEPAIVLGVLALFLERPTCELASNVYQGRTFAKGLDVEVVSLAALKTVHTVGTLEQKEHVTLGIYQQESGQSEEFYIRAFKNNGHGHHLWPGPDTEPLCVDTPEDLERLNRRFGKGAGNAA